MKIGLIVNPVAGIGGSVGLKGSDGAEIQGRALALGAIPHAGERAARALLPLYSLRDDFMLLTAPGVMGETIAVQSGFKPHVLGTPPAKVTTAEDTVQAARAMQAAGVDLLLFAGGDGTACDIVRTVGLDLLALGIPAGVKIHSAVFAINPYQAGEVAAGFLGGMSGTLEAEVVDLDEQAYRQGMIDTRLVGFLRIPYQPLRVQRRKAPAPASDATQMASIAAAVKESIRSGWLYILGPGTTTQAVAECLGFRKTLVGVDVIADNGPIILDATEGQIIALLAGRQPTRAKIIVTPIGGQGFLFGRGNQQISPAVIRIVGQDNIIILCLPGKLAALGGRPLLIDSGDPELDRMLAGYYRIITGYQERAIYRLEG